MDGQHQAVQYALLCSQQCAIEPTCRCCCCFCCFCLGALAAVALGTSSVAAAAPAVEAARTSTEAVSLQKTDRLRGAPASSGTARRAARPAASCKGFLQTNRIVSNTIVHVQSMQWPRKEVAKANSALEGLSSCLLHTPRMASHSRLIRRHSHRIAPLCPLLSAQPTTLRGMNFQTSAPVRNGVAAAAAGVPIQRRRRQGRAPVAPPLAAAAAEVPSAGSQLCIEEGADVVGTVVWAGPKGAKVLLPDNSVGFMPSREAPYVIRDANEERAPDSGRNQVRHG